MPTTGTAALAPVVQPLRKGTTKKTPKRKGGKKKG